MLQDLFNRILVAQFGVFFSFSTKALNIHNSCTSVIPKVGVHLGVIGLHSLHFSPFVKVCFTPKHTLCVMGPCTSHFVVNRIATLRQLKTFFPWGTWLFPGAI
jgi:hypothetical protein